MLGAVGEFGFLVAIPLVLFALAGRFIDSKFGSSPLFFLIGILLAIIISTFIIYQKTAALLKESEEDQPNKPTSYQLPPTS